MGNPSIVGVGRVTTHSSRCELAAKLFGKEGSFGGETKIGEKGSVTKKGV